MLHLIGEHSKVATNASPQYGDQAAVEANIAAVGLAMKWIRDAPSVDNLLVSKIADTSDTSAQQQKDALSFLLALAGYLFEEWDNKHENAMPVYTRGATVPHGQIRFPWNILLFESPFLLYNMRDIGYPFACQFATTRFANCLNVLAGKKEFFIQEEFSLAVGPDHEYLSVPFVEKGASEKKNVSLLLLSWCWFLTLFSPLRNHHLLLRSVPPQILPLVVVNLIIRIKHKIHVLRLRLRLRLRLLQRSGYLNLQHSSLAQEP
jgi:hypothetical protein